jgi:hypothetical protein
MVCSCFSGIPHSSSKICGWCRGFASGWCVKLALLLLLAFDAWFDLVVLWSRLNSEVILPVLAVPGVLGDLPCWLVDDWSRVYCGKVLYVPGFALLVDSLACSLWWLTGLCVLLSMHTAWWAGWLCVCVKCFVLGLVLVVRWISSADSWSYPLHHNLFANLLSGNATWHNALIVMCVCRDQENDQEKIKIFLSKNYIMISNVV